MPEISTAGIFQVAFIARQMKQTPRAFFQTAFEPSVGCVPQGTHAVGWGCRENGERVRAYRTHPTFGLQLAVFLAEPLIPTAAPSSLPWERVRERATSRKACIWAVSVLGKIAEIRGMPSPQPSPTGEGADCSRFRRCRSSEKECPKYQQQDFFRQPLSPGRWNKRRERFFRRPLNPAVGCVPQGTHAVDWGGRENRERVRAYRTHPTCRLRLATLFWLKTRK